MSTNRRPSIAEVRQDVRKSAQGLSRSVIKKVQSVGNMVDAVVKSKINRTPSWTNLDERAERHRSPSPRHPFDPKLHCAVGEGNIGSVVALLDSGRCDVNQEDYEKRTPLHVAASLGNLAMVEVLVRYKADVNSVDARNRSPLFEAGEHQDIVDYLKRHGAVDSLKYFAKKAAEVDAESHSVESTDVISSNFLRKVLVTLMLPILILLFINGTWFAVKFLIVTVVYYLVGVAFFVSEITIRPPWYRPNAKKLTMHQLPEYWQGIVHDPKYDLGLDYEDVWISTPDGYRLSGWYVPCAVGSPSHSTGVVLVHGGGRDRRAFLRHVRMFHEEGFPVLLFDFREHGMSQGTGRGFTYGMKERIDVAAAARYLKQRCSLRTLVVMGTSVGGSAAIMAAAIEPCIDIIIAENPITTVGYLQHQHIYSILGGYFQHTRLTILVFQFFRFMARKWINLRVGNIPSKKCQAAHVIASLSPRPVLLMHGTADEVVPQEHSELLFAKAREPKELWMAADGFHCGLYDMYPQEFRKRVVGFIRTYAR